MAGFPSDEELIYQFNRSYREDFVPNGFDGGDDRLFHIKNDYPKDSGLSALDDYPWLDIDFKTEPKRYIGGILNYCFTGMLECDFIAQKNQVRQSSLLQSIDANPE